MFFSPHISCQKLPFLSYCHYIQDAIVIHHHHRTFSQTIQIYIQANTQNEIKSMYVKWISNLMIKESEIVLELAQRIWVH